MDAASNAPIKGAVVMVPDGIPQTDDKGMVLLSRPASHLWVRAQGHGRVEMDNAGKNKANIVVRLPAVTPKALYLSVYGVGNEHLRGNALKLIDETELNALVIDVKGDRGMVPYRSAVPLAAEIGAQRIITVSDIRDLISRLRQRSVYLIARVVVFKDELLAEARPELAVKSGGRIWRDREQLAWTDPFRPEVWQYNLDIAEEAARLGFDEIQFDYLRFPDRRAGLFAAEHRAQPRRRHLGLSPGGAPAPRAL